MIRGSQYFPRGVKGHQSLTQVWGSGRLPRRRCRVVRQRQSADCSVSGNQVAGDSVAGDSVAGDSVAGDSVAGQNT